MENHHKVTRFIIIGVSMLVVVVAVVSYVGASRGIFGNKVQLPTTETDNRKTYSNKQYGFSFRYAGNLNAYEWQPNSLRYSVATRVMDQGTGNNIILSTLDYSKPIVDEYGTDVSSVRISEENGEAWIKNAVDAEDFWNNLTKTDESGAIVNKLVEIKVIDGTKFVIFDQYGWSVAAQSKIWTHQALFSHNGKFFWVRGSDSVGKTEFYSLLDSFKFTTA